MIRVFAAALLATTLGFAAGEKDMKDFYARSCAGCHGQDGSAKGPTGQRLGGRPLTDPRWQARVPDSQMVHAILKGKGPMPAYESQLSEAEALKLVTDVIRPMAAKKK